MGIQCVVAKGKQTSLHNPARAKRENSYLYCGRCWVIYVEESHRKVTEHRIEHCFITYKPGEPE